MRPNGIFATCCSRIASGMPRVIAVSMNPGQMALAVTWERASSFAAVLVSPTTPALAAA